MCIRDSPWNARAVGDYIRAYEAALPPDGWPNWVLGNHDQHRIASRVGPAQARVAQMLLLTLRGTPTSYYGDEIGMVDVPIPLAECMDPAALQQPELFEVWGRDPERTPMQWDDSPNAGFAPDGARPWLPLAADYATRNVAAQEHDPASMLSLFRALTALRRAEPALNRGGIELINTGIEDVLAYRRTVEGGDSFLIILNFGKEMQELDLHAAFGVTKAEVVLSTEAPRSRLMNRVSTSIGGNEGLILRLPELTA